MTTFIVRASGGNDANDGLTFATAWDTLQFMHDTMVAGDVGLVASDGIHSPAVTVDLDTNAGATSNPIRWRGAGPLGQDDGSVVTINGTSMSVGDIFKSGAANSMNHTWFEGFRFTDGFADCFDLSTAQQGIIFQRCQFDGATALGCNVGNFDSNVSLVDCEIDNNGNVGVGAVSSSGGKLWLRNCKVHDNAFSGIQAREMSVIGCWIYKNGNDGIRPNGTNNGETVDVHNCVIDGNTQSGMRFLSGVNNGGVSITNNIISNNTLWGINLGNNAIAGIRGNNLYFNNGSGDVTFNGTTVATLAAFESLAGSITGDPLFLNTGAGTEDYRTASGSPARDVGFPSTFPDGGAIVSHIGTEFPLAVAAAAGGGIIGG